MKQWSYLLKNLGDIYPLPFPLKGKIIHFSQDTYGRMLVIEDGAYRILNFDSPFEQSCMRMDHPYRLVHQHTQRMIIVLAFINPQIISLFGLGGGSLLRTLHHVLPNCIFNVVELRQKVVDIAKEYFAVPSDHRVRITVNDALAEISNVEDHTSDVIFSDMYNAYQIVPAQTQNAFLLNCSRVLTDRGWLVINLFDLPGNRVAFFEQLAAVFPTIILCASEGNTILLVSNAEPETVYPRIQHIEAIENVLLQRFSQLLSRLEPINFRFSQCTSKIVKRSGR
ncbi:methyltransferase domain-containing protein [Haliea sp. E1-2-M8]|uniref:spermidine synthase n=1 Tax=Haliea sp. E1-2-M8 TaxID=3064706 RepID=UPI00271D52C7|nr:methyltransferase domain-containing protein [Haliea sp. E1-2-M8]MDO8863693.1 methyltransferase domain-containing protein [Haliea sp. E1-2-M8]